MANYNILYSLISNIKTIIDGFKILAKGFSYFIFLPLNILGVSLAPGIIQLIYLGILAWIINKFVKNWAYTFIIIFLLLILGLLR